MNRQSRSSDAPAASVERPEGFEVPLSLSLTQPVLMGGAPRVVAIVNGTFAAALSLGLGAWWAGVPLGLALHTAAIALTRADPHWFEVFKRQAKQPGHFEG